MGGCLGTKAKREILLVGKFWIRQIFRLLKHERALLTALSIATIGIQQMR